MVATVTIILAVSVSLGAVLLSLCVYLLWKYAQKRSTVIRMQTKMKRHGMAVLPSINDRVSSRRASSFMGQASVDGSPSPSPRMSSRRRSSVHSSKHIKAGSGSRRSRRRSSVGSDIEAAASAAREGGASAERGSPVASHVKSITPLAKAQRGHMRSRSGDANSLDGRHPRRVDSLHHRTASVPVTSNEHITLPGMSPNMTPNMRRISVSTGSSPSRHAAARQRKRSISHSRSPRRPSRVRRPPKAQSSADSAHGAVQQESNSRVGNESGSGAATGTPPRLRIQLSNEEGENVMSPVLLPGVASPDEIQ